MSRLVKWLITFVIPDFGKPKDDWRDTGERDWQAVYYTESWVLERRMKLLVNFGEHAQPPLERWIAVNTGFPWYEERVRRIPTCSD